MGNNDTSLLVSAIVLSAGCLLSLVAIVLMVVYWFIPYRRANVDQLFSHLKFGMDVNRDVALVDLDDDVQAKAHVSRLDLAIKQAFEEGDNSLLGDIIMSSYSEDGTLNPTARQQILLNAEHRRVSMAHKLLVENSSSIKANSAPGFGM